MKVDTLVLSCEHGGNRVPPRYRRLFATRKSQNALRGHRGHDIGALHLARTLSGRLGAPLVYSTVTRLLVECNRSVRHPQLFSEFSAALDGREREEVLQAYYFTHREQVHAAIRKEIEAGRSTLHVAVHTFTPRLRGQTRRVDIGLLYDPQRPTERCVGARWKATLLALQPGLTVRRNYPYHGRADGLTTALRRFHGPESYIGIELETNQALLTGNPGRRKQIINTIGRSLRELID